MLTPIPKVEDPRWNEVTRPLQELLARGEKSWDEIFAWAEMTWDEVPAPRGRSRSYARQHFVRNAVAWLEHQGLAGYSRSRRRWRAAKRRGAAVTTSAPKVTKRRRPTLFHRTCHACGRSYFSPDRASKLCPGCRPPGCALCGAALPPTPVEDRFCSERHAARSRPSPRRPHRHLCTLPECGSVFWGPEWARFCCSAHRESHRQRSPRFHRGSLSPAALQQAREHLDELELSLTETARLLGVHRSTLGRALGRHRS